MNLRAFFLECKKRNVISNLSFYAVSVWILIQVAATTFPYLGFPKIAVTFVIILALVGLPVTILLSWYYNLVPDTGGEGIRKNIDDETTKESKSTFAIFMGFISLLVIFFVFRLITSNISPDQPNIMGDDTEKIAVAKFENNTLNPDLDIIGKMAADWITHGIVHNNIAPVVDYETLEDLKGVSLASLSGGNAEQLAKLVGGKIRVIHGAYYKQGENLIFQCSISDSQGSQFDFAFENIQSTMGEELEGIEKVKQQILAYLTSLGTSEFNAEDKIPSYDAYKYYLEAKALWTKDYEYAIQLLKKSLELDPDFLNAKIMMMGAYYNLRKYAIVDSIIQQIRADHLSLDNEFTLSEIQKLNLRHHEVNIKGENLEAFNTLIQFGKKFPNDKFINIEMMVLAIEYVNRPDIALQIYNSISDDEFDYSKCLYCFERREMKARADMLNGDINKAIKNLEQLKDYYPRRRTLEILVKAYVRQKSFGKLDKLLEAHYKDTDLDRDWRYLSFIAASECAVTGNTSSAMKYGQQALDYYSEGPPRHNMLGRIHLILENFEKAKYHFEQYLEERPGFGYTIAKLAVAEYKLGNFDVTENLLDKLGKLTRPYDFGALEYYMAEVNTQMGNYKKAFELLSSSLEKGRQYNLHTFQNNPLLTPLFNDPRFEKIMTYWH